MWAEITYLFPNLNGAASEAWELTGDFILHFALHVIISYIIKSRINVKLCQQQVP